MAEYKSEVKSVPYSDEEIYTILSDLTKLDLIKDKIPQDKLKDFTYDKDSCTVNVAPIGNIRFVIIEREPNSSVKFEAEQLPFKLNLSIKLEHASDNDTQMQLKVDADLNPFLKPMVSKPLQEGLEKMAEALASIPYRDLNNG